MKVVLVTILLVITGQVFAQNKYIIYLKDKGNFNEQTLFKMGNLDSLARQFLSSQSIERRKKNVDSEFFTYEDLPIAESYITKIERKGISIVHKLKWFNAVSAYLTEAQVRDLKKEDFILKIVRSKKLKSPKPILNKFYEDKKLQKKPLNQSLDYGNSLSQNAISDIPAVHEMDINGEGVIIGLLDSGYDWENHVALSDRDVIAEYDFVFGDDETANDSLDGTATQHDHGTKVFSIIAGFDEGNLIGPAFGASYILAKTEYVPTETHSEEDNYAAALEWMDSIGVDITTSSLGYSDGFESHGEESYTYENMDGKSTIVTKATEIAFNKGIVVITSAGNEGNKAWKYITAPGDGFNMLTIGAVNSSNQLASFSSRGPTYDGRIKPELLAQGVGVRYALSGSGNGYGQTSSGTSFSAPIAAGVAGLLLSAHPHLLNSQVRSILIESGDNVENPNNDRGYGLISALKAVTYPNLEKSGSSYILHKIFKDNSNIDETSVIVNFNDSTSYPMVKNEKVFNLELPVMVPNQYHEFFFTYKTLSDEEIREPANKNYRFRYGDLNIGLILNPDGKKLLPDRYLLSQNYPNPFNPSTRIEYSLPESHGESLVTIKLFNILGQEVKKLVNEVKGPGNYFYDLTLKGLSAGIYFYQLQTKQFTKTKKMTYLR